MQTIVYSLYYTILSAPIKILTHNKNYDTSKLQKKDKIFLNNTFSMEEYGDQVPCKDCVLEQPANKIKDRYIMHLITEILLYNYRSAPHEISLLPWRKM